MILVDFSNLAVNSFYAAGEAPSVDLFRHMVFNILRTLGERYGNKYGKVVLCMDSRNYWRLDLHPGYKGKRKEKKKTSSFDWEGFYKAMDTVVGELMEEKFFPVVLVDRMEADDIIATIVMKSPTEDIMIYSSDGDFVQLQQNPRVKQYSPILKKELIEKNPAAALQEKLLRGDSGDGIPNVRSPLDSFANNKRQASITQVFVESFMRDGTVMLSEDEYERYKQNDSLINLTKIPEKYQQQIWDKFEEQTREKRKFSSLVNYFVKNRMKNMFAEVNSFRGILNVE